MKMLKKYELTEKNEEGLYRIRALRDFSDIKKGDLGGFIASEDNLSSYGDCWIYGNAQVFGNARVAGNAWVAGNARVYEGALVYGNAQVFGNAKIEGNFEGICIAQNYSVNPTLKDIDWMDLWQPEFY